MTTRSKPAVRATDTRDDASPFALGLLMRRAHDRAAGELVRALRPLGLELRHFAVLINLNAHGSMSQSELVAAIGTDKASMVRVVDDLESRDLVARKPFPGDRRVHAVELTPQGLEVFDAAHVAAAPIAGELVAHLAPGEAELLFDLLTRFTYPPGQE
ncbi:MAG TPA: MarR family transcriptional regulator [Pseudonocardiaceae bacterium]|nr:MarR family transcriptional regulator [Pseudonocardiaceae bacterium]